MADVVVGLAGDFDLEAGIGGDIEALPFAIGFPLGFTL
jgi:hypothetical protein